MALAAEVGESSSIFNGSHSSRRRTLRADTREEVALEAADVFLFLLRLCDKLDIDLSAAAERKLALECDQISGAQGARPLDKDHKLKAACSRIATFSTPVTLPTFSSIRSWTRLLIALAAKDKPYLYLDTHAGIGRYDLTHPWAQKAREDENGIARIWKSRAAPQALEPYLEAVRTLNAYRALHLYRASPDRAAPRAPGR